MFITKPIFPNLEDYTKNLQRIWDLEILTNSGEFSVLLENNLKEYLKLQNLKVISNGTIALMIAIKALRLHGSVITSPFTFPATISALEWCGLKPVFCDVDYKTGNIDVEKIESLIQNDTSAILPIHVFGIPCDVKKIDNIAQRHGLKVLYDAAHTFGVEVSGKALSSFGDMSILSFHATKLFHTAEGGAIVFKNAHQDKNIHLLRNFGIQAPESVVLSGINGKMNELNAALGVEVLKLVDKEIEDRKKVFEYYTEALKDYSYLSLPKIPSGVSKWNYQYFFMQTKARDPLVDFLVKENIIARKYFYPLCRSYSKATEETPTAETFSKHSMVLPLYGAMTEEDTKKVVSSVEKFFSKRMWW